jgi:hypothetical protein
VTVFKRLEKYSFSSLHQCFGVLYHLWPYHVQMSVLRRAMEAAAVSAFKSNPVTKNCPLSRSI